MCRAALYVEALVLLLCCRLSAYVCCLSAYVCCRLSAYVSRMGTLGFVGFAAGSRLCAHLSGLFSRCFALHLRVYRKPTTACHRQPPLTLSPGTVVYLIAGHLPESSRCITTPPGLSRQEGSWRLAGTGFRCTARKGSGAAP